MTYPPDDPQGGHFPPPGYGPSPGYPPSGYGTPPPGYPPGGFGQPPFGQPPQDAIPTYTWQAVTVTVLGVLCCCFGLVSTGFGIASLVTSSQVRDRQRAGDIEGALAASRRIKTFLIVATAVLAVSLVSWIILYSLGGTFTWQTN